MRAFYRWRHFPATVVVAAIGLYLIAEQIFGPYRHWTLWVRGPIATVVMAGFVWQFAGKHLWRARKRTGWW